MADQVITLGNEDYMKPVELPDSVPERADIVRNRRALGGNEYLTVPAAPELGFFGTAYEMYMQETVIGDALRYGIVPTDKSYANYKYDPQSGFNPYRYFLDNRETLLDMEEHIRGYLFDDVYDEKQFKDRVQRLRTAAQYRDSLANGNVAGMLLGGVLGFVDVTTLIPGVNIAKKASTIGKIGKWALAGAYYSGIQEAALHMRQELRTVDESIYNVIGGTVIGGGFGVFGRALDPHSPLYYKGSANPLSPNNPVRLGIGRIGTGMSENVVIKPVIQGGKRTYEVVAETGFGKSVGAAAVEGTKLIKSGAMTAQGVLRVPVKAFGKAGEFALTKAVRRFSPIVRGLTQESERGRTITEKLFNIGGILTEGIRQGKFTRSVEDAKQNFMNRFEMEVLPMARDTFVRLRMDLAQMQGETFSPALAGAADGAARAKQLGKDVLAGPYNKTPRERGLNQSGKLDEWEFHDLTEKALFDDLTDLELDNLAGRFGEAGRDAIVAAVKEQAERIHKMNEAFVEDMRAAGMEFEDLGRDYGHAQLWRAAGIRANRSEATRFFLEYFGSKPSEEFLADFNLTMDQFLKLGVEPVTVKRTVYEDGATPTSRKVEKQEDVTLSVDEGRIQKIEILEEWNAGQKTREEAELDVEIDVAEMAAKQAQRDAVLAGRALRKSYTEIKNASLDELRAMLTKRVALRDRAQAEVKKLKAERTKANEELKLAEAEMLERMNTFHDTSKRASSLRRQRGKDVSEAEALLKMVDEEGGSASKADYEFAKDQLIKADNELARAGDDALDEAVTALENKPVSNRRIATLKERIRLLDQRIKMKDDAIVALDTKLTHFSELVGAASAKKQAVVDLQKLRREMAKAATKEARKAKRRVGKLKRKLRKSEAKAPLHLYVEDLVNKLGNNQRDPFGGFESELVIGNTGRTQRRHIRLTNEQRREAIRLGLLRDDLYGILGKQVDDLSSRLALRQVFGGTSEKGIVEDLQAQVREEYNSLIDQAAGKPRRIRKLEKQRDTAIADIEKGVQRHLGILGLPANPESMLGWLGGAARQWNYVRYGSGFLIPSMADLSNVVFTSGFGTFSFKYLKGLHRTVNGMSSREIRLLALASERIMHNSRTMKMNQAEAGRELAGIGDYGTLKHYTTSTAERVMEGFSEATNVASGMAWWNTRMKALAMVAMQDQFVRHAIKYDQLLAAASAGNKQSEQIIAELASLGLGRAEMQMVQKMMQKYAPALEEGIYELNMGRWLAEGKAGQDAFEAVNIALNNVATRAIMTPGKGDTPFLMSDNLWKTIGQFQTYGFVTINKYMLPAFQRMATYGDMEAFMSMALAAALGYGIVMATDIKRNGEIKDRTVGQWAYDTVDRAGFLMMLSTPIAEISKQLGVGDVSRYSMEKNRISLLGGPTGGLINDLWDGVNAATQGDVDRLTQVGTKLMPFKLYKQMADVALGN